MHVLDHGIAYGFCVEMIFLIEMLSDIFFDLIDSDFGDTPNQGSDFGDILNWESNFGDTSDQFW